jgi:hypothetical protein
MATVYSPKYPIRGLPNPRVAGRLKSWKKTPLYKEPNELIDTWAITICITAKQSTF